MKSIWIRFLLCAGIFGFLGTGCAHRAKQTSPKPVFAEPIAPAPTTNASQPKLIISPEEGLTGTVSKVNAIGRYVVLTFPLGHMPALEQHLNVYHQGMKVGEVRVTGPQLDDNIVADILSGEAAVTDEVRDR